jgi:two-component system OmpR family response regulator
MRAVIIEDDVTIAEFVARGLREAGFAVDHAADGESGLDLMTSSPFDVAIVDLMLPKLDGLSVIAAMRLPDEAVRVPRAPRPRTGPDSPGHRCAVVDASHRR